MTEPSSKEETESEETSINSDKNKGKVIVKGFFDSIVSLDKLNFKLAYVRKESVEPISIAPVIVSGVVCGAAGAAICAALGVYISLLSSGDGADTSIQLVKVNRDRIYTLVTSLTVFGSVVGFVFGASASFILAGTGYWKRITGYLTNPTKLAVFAVVIGVCFGCFFAGKKEADKKIRDTNWGGTLSLVLFSVLFAWMVSSIFGNKKS